MSTIENQELVRCCVKNCQKETPKDRAIKIGDDYYCGICGMAYYRSQLNI